MTPERVRELVMARAAVVHKEHRMSVVNAAWKGMFPTYKPGERPPRAVSNSPAVVGADAEAPGQAGHAEADTNGADPAGADGAGPANAVDAGRAEDAKAVSAEEEEAGDGDASRAEDAEAGSDDQEGFEEESEYGWEDRLADICLCEWPSTLASAMKKTLTNLSATKPLLDVPYQEVIEDLSKTLGRTPKQLERIEDVIGAHYMRTAKAMLIPELEVPLHYMNEARQVPWESLSMETQCTVTKLDVLIS